jgi:hypothetical protein
MLDTIQSMEDHEKVRWDDWSACDKTRWDDHDEREKMNWDHWEQQEKSRWETMEESIDLLFSKVGEIDKTQQQMSNQIDISAQILVSVVKDQVMLAGQLDATGQAVARLTLDRPPVEEVPRPTRPSVRMPQMGELSSHEDTYGHPHHPGAQGGRAGNNLFQQHLPKMSFPRFNGENPRIWKDKCLNYFHIFNLPEALWLPTATMCVDDNAARWLQVYKLKQGLTDWNTFIAVVEEQFGSYDYRDAIGDLVALTQDGNLNEYISTFSGLQYQVQMHMRQTLLHSL